MRNALLAPLRTLLPLAVFGALAVAVEPLAEIPRKSFEESQVDAQVTLLQSSVEEEQRLVEVTGGTASADQLRGRVYASRIAASEALGQMDPRVARTSLPFLIRTLDGMSASLGTSPDAFAVTHQDDLHAWARAARALGQIGDPLGAPALVRALRATKAQEITVRRDVLREQGPSTETFQMRRDLLLQVRLAVLEALGRLQVPYTVPPLVDALDDPELVIRTAAHENLRRITNHDHPYDPKAEDVSRRLGQGRWRQWWQQAHAADRLDWIRDGYATAGIDVGDLRDRACLPTLATVLDHRHPWFRANARERILELSWDVPLDGLRALRPVLVRDDLHPDARDTLALLFQKLAGRHAYLQWLRARVEGTADDDEGSRGVSDPPRLPFSYESALAPIRESDPDARRRAEEDSARRRAELVRQMDTWLQAEIDAASTPADGSPPEEGAGGDGSGSAPE